MNFILYNKYVFASGFKFALKGTQPFTRKRYESMEKLYSHETDDIEDRYYECDQSSHDFRVRAKKRAEWTNTIGYNSFGEWLRCGPFSKYKDLTLMLADQTPDDPEHFYFLPELGGDKTRSIKVAQDCAAFLSRELHNPDISAQMIEFKDDHSSIFLDYVKLSYDDLVLLSLIGTPL